MKPSLFIFAGEKSGDLHGANLIKKLRNEIKNHHEIIFEGVPGPKMRAVNVAETLRMEDFEVMGFTDVILSLPKLYISFYKILNHILNKKPLAVILIDYPGFNLRLAKALRKEGYKGKIVQYVSPTVWAWGKDRIQKMAATLDLLLSIYPFEKALFDETTLKTVYIGNPLCEYIKSYQYVNHWKKEIGIDENCPLVAIFPGSRQREITGNLPIAVGAAKKILKDHPSMKFAVSDACDSTQKVLDDLLKNCDESLRNSFYIIPRKYTYELMQASSFAIAKSGTVTLELALHKCPTVVIYKLTFLNRLYAKYILKLKLKSYCIVNILSGRDIFPELIEKTLTEDSLYETFNSLNPELTIDGCHEIQQMLQKDLEASVLGAQEIKKLLLDCTPKGFLHV